jgi:DNA polymerase III alpha subunit (gram-positive type)
MNTLVYWDTETDGIDPTKCNILQVGAIVLDAEDDDLPIMDNGLFVSYMRPDLTDEQIDDPEIISDSALRVNHINREDIKNFPDSKVVWNNFAKFCYSFKRGGELPVACGWNIKDFDNIIMDRYNKKYMTRRFFHENNYFDLMIMDWALRQRDPLYSGKSFDLAAEHYGIQLEPGDKPHTADADCKRGAKLMRWYLRRLWRGGRSNHWFRGVLAKDD